MSLCTATPSKIRVSSDASALCIIRRFSARTQRFQLVGLDRLTETNFWFRCYRTPDLEDCLGIRRWQRAAILSRELLWPPLHSVRLLPIPPLVLPTPEILMLPNYAG